MLGIMRAPRRGWRGRGRRRRGRQHRRGTTTPARGRSGRPCCAARRARRPPAAVEGGRHPVGVHLQARRAARRSGRPPTRVRRTQRRAASPTPRASAPSARSSTCSAAARCRVAASCGVVSAARRTSTDSIGLALWGIVDEPPPVPSASSPISGRRHREDVVGDPAAGVGAADERVADPGDRWPGWCARGAGRRGRGRGPPRRPGRPGRRRARGPRPGCRPPRRAAPGRRSRATSSYASRTPVSQDATLQPEGGRHGVLGEGARRPSGCPGGCRRARRGAATTLGRGRRTGLDGVARHQHQRGVERRPGW